MSQVCVGYHNPCMSCSCHDLALHSCTPSLPQLLVVVGCSPCYCNSFCHACWNFPHYLHWLCCTDQAQNASTAQCWVYIASLTSGYTVYVVTHRFPRDGPQREKRPEFLHGNGRKERRRATAFAHLTFGIEKKKYFTLTSALPYWKFPEILHFIACVVH